MTSAVTDARVSVSAAAEHDVDAAVIFLHIPKTAGSTLHSIIERQYPAGAIYNTIGVRNRKAAERFRELPEADRARIRVLKGHMGFFGWHEFLPGPAVYITLLRHPVDRIISHYYYVLRSPGHPAHSHTVAEGLSLGDYLRAELTKEIDNQQTRILSALPADVGGCSRLHLEQAQRHIVEHFALVGLTERFDESLILLRRLLGWGSLFYGRRRVTPGRPREADVDRDTISLIERYNELDLELYRFAERRFEASIREAGPSLGRELRSFRRWNAPISSISSRLFGACERLRWARREAIRILGGASARRGM
jgi:hypothetical protein